MSLETAKDLLVFIEKSPSCYHVVQNMKNELSKEGFTEVFYSSNICAMQNLDPL